jgi:hypothetical protein
MPAQEGAWHPLGLKPGVPGTVTCSPLVRARAPCDGGDPRAAHSYTVTRRPTISAPWPDVSSHWSRRTLHLQRPVDGSKMVSTSASVGVHSVAAAPNTCGCGCDGCASGGGCSGCGGGGGGCGGGCGSGCSGCGGGGCGVSSDMFFGMGQTGSGLENALSTVRNAVSSTIRPVTHNTRRNSLGPIFSSSTYIHDQPHIQLNDSSGKSRNNIECSLKCHQEGMRRIILYGGLVRGLKA